MLIVILANIFRPIGMLTFRTPFIFWG